MVIRPSTRGGAASVSVRMRAAATMTCAKRALVDAYLGAGIAAFVGKGDGEAAADDVPGDRLAHLRLELLAARAADADARRARGR